MNTKHLRTWVTIDDKAILHNVNAYKTLLDGRMGLMAVIKNNAYGHGSIRVAALLEKRVHHFGVVVLEEAIALRNSGIRTPILVFSNALFDTDMLAEAIRKKISLTVYNKESFEIINRTARKLKMKAMIHVNIDTGMTRLGFDDTIYTNIIKKVCASNHLIIRGLYSHLSSADSDMLYTGTQCRKFEQAIKKAEAAHCTVRYKHVSNTAGVLFDMYAGNMVRIGKGMYGLPIPGYRDVLKRRQKNFPKFNPKPALEWKTRILQIREVDNGVSIGYDRSYKTKKKMTVATLPIGFGDGYRRCLSNRGGVLIRGRYCPIVGNVCMGNTMVNISHLRAVRSGDEVTLIGTDKGQTISAWDIAQLAETNPTEILTNISSDIPRI